MESKEKLFRLFDALNEHDQRAAFEFIQDLAKRNGKKMDHEDVIQVYGKNYYVVPD
ncbi:hypothetical protein [Paenibacillus sp. H1-7]|uniref:hypothetical protein n=1 Tax=Paenibacillus sp. H1-7 TaxID=2282849 RepID=UPI001EF905F3|nr:hypothetical protein [Paenibacillus sp. H1-7]